MTDQSEPKLNKKTAVELYNKIESGVSKGFDDASNYLDTMIDDSEIDYPHAFELLKKAREKRKGLFSAPDKETSSGGKFTTKLLTRLLESKRQDKNETVAKLYMDSHSEFIKKSIIKAAVKDVQGNNSELYSQIIKSATEESIIQMQVDLGLSDANTETFLHALLQSGQDLPVQQIEDYIEQFKRAAKAVYDKQSYFSSSSLYDVAEHLKGAAEKLQNEPYRSQMMALLYKHTSDVNKSAWLDEWVQKKSSSVLQELVTQNAETMDNIKKNPKSDFFTMKDLTLEQLIKANTDASFDEALQRVDKLEQIENPTLLVALARVRADRSSNQSWSLWKQSDKAADLQKKLLEKLLKSDDLKSIMESYVALYRDLTQEKHEKKQVEDKMKNVPETDKLTVSQELQRKTSLVDALTSSVSDISNSISQYVVDNIAKDNAKFFKEILKASPTEGQKALLKASFVSEQDIRFLTQDTDEKLVDIVSNFYHSTDDKSVKSKIVNMAVEGGNLSLSGKLFTQLDEIVEMQIALHASIQADTFIHAAIRSEKLTPEAVGELIAVFNQHAIAAATKTSKAQYMFSATTFDVVSAKGKDGQTLFPIVQQMKDEAYKNKMLSVLYQSAIMLKHDTLVNDIITDLIKTKNMSVLKGLLSQDADLLLKLSPITQDVKFLESLFQAFTPQERMSILQREDGLGKSVLATNPQLLSIWNKAQEERVASAEAEAKAEKQYQVVIWQEDPKNKILVSAQALLSEASRINTVLENKMQFAMVDQTGNRRSSEICILDENPKTGTRCIALISTDDNDQKHIRVLFETEAISRRSSDALEIVAKTKKLQDITVHASAMGFDFQKISTSLREQVSKQKTPATLSFIGKGLDGLNAQYAMGQVLLDLNINQATPTIMPTLNLITLNTPPVTSELQASMNETLNAFDPKKKPILSGYAAVVDGALFVSATRSILPERSGVLTVLPNVALRAQLDAYKVDLSKSTRQQGEIEHHLSEAETAFKVENKKSKNLERAKRNLNEAMIMTNQDGSNDVDAMNVLALYKQAAEIDFSTFRLKISPEEMQYNKALNEYSKSKTNNQKVNLTKATEDLKNSIDTYKKCLQEYSEPKWTETRKNFALFQKMLENNSAYKKALISRIAITMSQSTEGPLDFSELQNSESVPSHAVVPASEPLFFIGENATNTEIAVMVDELARNPNYQNLNFAANRISSLELYAIHDAKNRKELEAVLQPPVVSRTIHTVSQFGAMVDAIIPSVVQNNINYALGLRADERSEATQGTRAFTTGVSAVALTALGVGAGVGAGGALALSTPAIFAVGSGYALVSGLAALTMGTAAQRIHAQTLGHRDINNMIKVTEKTINKVVAFTSEVSTAWSTLHTGLNTLAPQLLENLGIPKPMVMLLQVLQQHTKDSTSPNALNDYFKDPEIEKMLGYSNLRNAVVKGGAASLESVSGIRMGTSTVAHVALTPAESKQMYGVYQKVLVHQKRLNEFYSDCPKILDDLYAVFAEIAPQSAAAFSVYWHEPSEPLSLKLQRLWTAINSGDPLTIAEIKKTGGDKIRTALNGAIELLRRTAGLPGLSELTSLMQPLTTYIVDQALEPCIDLLANELVDRLEEMQKSMSDKVKSVGKNAIKIGTEKAAKEGVKAAVGWSIDIATGAAATNLTKGMDMFSIGLGTTTVRAPQQLVTNKLNSLLFTPGNNDTPSYGDKIASATARAYTALDATPGVGSAMNKIVGGTVAAVTATKTGGSVVQLTALLAGAATGILVAPAAAAAVGTFTGAGMVAGALTAGTSFAATNLTGLCAALFQEKIVKDSQAAPVGAFAATSAKTAWNKAWLLRPSELEAELEKDLAQFNSNFGTKQEKLDFIKLELHNAFQQFLRIETTPPMLELPEPLTEEENKPRVENQQLMLRLLQSNENSPAELEASAPVPPVVFRLPSSLPPEKNIENKIKEFLNNVTENYANAMSNSTKKIWGGDIEIEQIGLLLDVKILVHSENGEIHTLGSLNNNSVIHLLHTNGDHYVVADANGKKTVDTKPNGNCLFEAVLFARKGSVVEDKEINELRQSVSDSILKIHREILSGATQSPPGYTGAPVRLTLEQNDPVYLRFNAIFKATNMSELEHALAYLPRSDLRDQALELKKMADPQFKPDQSIRPSQ